MATNNLLKSKIALIGVLLFSSFLAPKTSMAATTKWQQNNVWVFAFQSEYLNWIHDTCIERWSVAGDTIIDGRNYHNLSRDYGYIDGAPVKGLWSYSDTPVATGNVISIREDAGKVYAVKSQYVDFLNKLYPGEDDFYIAPGEDESEMLLYDFTLKVGDIYPCAEASKVVEVSQITTQDHVLRKVLKLSNGLIIIEGIGCVNSIGTLVIYQNTSLSTEEVVSNNLVVRTTARLVSFGIGEQQGEYKTIYDGSKDYPLISRINDNNSHPGSQDYFELSGLRHSTLPTSSGLYIKDGRKVLIK